VPDYLRTPEDGLAPNLMDYGVSLGRRFRALKLWLVIRHYGVEGLRHHVRRHVELARRFTARVDEDPDFELVVPPPLNLVCFRHRGGDQVNQAIMDRLNASGDLFLTHTRLDDRLVLRMSIGQASTEEHHVEAAWRWIRETAAEVASESPSD
jgi:aromatic-L-amino-acid decarboxylase